MTKPLEGKQVVLTGAAGGLGGAVLAAVLEAGGTCYVPTRKTNEMAGRTGVHVVGGVDLTDEALVTRFYADLPPLWASVHLAGGYAGAAFVDTALADLRKQIDLNLVTAFLCSREAVRNMSRASVPEGRIVNVSSRAALVPGPGAVGYAAAKAAVSAFTQSLAEELKSTGILVNAIAPSIIDTPANRQAMPKANHARWPKAEELARTIVWLISTENRLTSGAIVPTYGAA